MVDKIDCAVIGAGVVGLAIGRALARAGREVVVLEAEAAIGTGSSSRNSEVVHAGLYYPIGSLKARTCSAGRALLYAFCREHGVPHRCCGKWIVATEPAQLPALRALQRQGIANGVPDLHWRDAEVMHRLEPELRCAAALHSPGTGIVDSHALMRALLADAEANGAAIALQSPVLSGSVLGGELRLEVGGSSPLQLSANAVVNSAGLRAPALSSRLAGYPAAQVPAAFFCKGSYFALAGPPPFSALVYPLHDAVSLGVHLTVDLAGQARFGPDVEWLPDGDALDYDVDPRRATGFYAAIRAYWPGLRDGALQPAYAGIRSKLAGPGQAARDFVIAGPEQHGVPGLVQLFGIESPGLTAALAIGEQVAAMLGSRG